MNSNKTVLAACIYGTEYLPMLLSFMETWEDQFEDIYLICAEVGPEVINDVTAAYPKINLLPQEMSLSKEMHVRISQKMIFWDYLATHLAETPHDFAIFADIDTVAVREIEAFCDGDVVITRREKESPYLINTGVVGLSCKALKSGFVSEWRRSTEEIINNPALLAQAIDPQRVYGGGDQMALIKLLGLEHEAGSYKDLSVRLVDCDDYNACGNVIDAGRARIVHLKASFHDFLLHRRPLIGPRKLEDSTWQLRVAMAANRKGTERLAKAGVADRRIARLYGFRPPIGLRSDLTLPAFLMFLHRAKARLRSTARRAATRLFRPLRSLALPKPDEEGSARAGL